jgi:hypothetical protein
VKLNATPRCAVTVAVGPPQRLPHRPRAAPAHQHQRTTREDQVVLEWATGRPLAELGARIAVMENGRGLQATRAISAGQVILSVPFSRIYSSEVRSASMAYRLGWLDSRTSNMIHLQCSLRMN